MASNVPLIVPSVTLSNAAPPESMLGRLPAILAYIVHVDSFLVLGVLAFVLSAVEWVGNLPSIYSSNAFVIERSIFCIYFLLVARKATSGSRRLPIPTDYLDTWDALMQPLLQAWLASSWYWMPLLFFAHSTVGLSDFIQRYQFHAQRFLCQQGFSGYLLLAAGILYLPLALLSAMTQNGLFRTLDPTAGFRLAWRIPWAYAVMYALLSVFGLIGILLGALSVKIEAALPIPLAAPVLGHLLRLWTPLAQARLLGEFIFWNKKWLEEPKVVIFSSSNNETISRPN